MSLNLFIIEHSLTNQILWSNGNCPCISVYTPNNTEIVKMEKDTAFELP